MLSSVMIVKGILEKMRTSPESPVNYYLEMAGESVHMNPLLGKKISLRLSGRIVCIGCGKDTDKSYSQGYCGKCFKTLAACDQCVMAPELCHYAKGTCREPAWGESHCMQPHTVYLAYSSGIKVGITRSGQRETRWMDQGASEALALGTVPTRRDAGFVEAALREYVSDRTQWREMLTDKGPSGELPEYRDILLPKIPSDIPFQEERGELQQFTYPVQAYPVKVTSIDLEAGGEIESVLIGIKGQYLIFESGVVNVRKYTGYEAELKFA
jgi:Protein of unknown function (DUF2797)